APDRGRLVRAVARARRSSRRLARFLLRARCRGGGPSDRTAPEQPATVGTGRMSDPAPQSMPEELRLQAFRCRPLGAPLYADLLELAADDFEAHGVVADLLGPYESEPAGAAYPIRMLGGVHRMVLAGAARQLEPFFPTTGGNGDAP